MFLIAGGIFGYLSLCLTWITNNVAPDYKRSVGLPLFIGLGNIGGIVSSNIYPSSDAPRYRMGLSSKVSQVCPTHRDRSLTLTSLLGLHDPRMGMRRSALVLLHP